MKRYLAVAIALLTFCGLGLAHGNEEHVMGRVTKVSEKSITVETQNKKTVVVEVTPETEFQRSGAKASVNDLKIGDRVVIHARKNGEELEAHTVRFGASHQAAASRDHSEKQH